MYILKIISLFQDLPRDILHIILSYDGTIKYRKGKYINQLSPMDSRRIMLRNFWTPLRLPFTYNDTGNFRTEIEFIFSPYSLYCDERYSKKYIRYYFRTIRKQIDGSYTITRDEYKRY